ncbi:F-box/LRR-repeat protein At5g02910-like [Salvia hispanica]|uniref:F-box/LRR-repeat protein At5g02910-like n=1 Tax=Salvia hispanica TaxID=49212 RepID=UPI002009675B|nr:F-box/LRR-repeat protein At5g02910-like [Salvia hispanica]
MLSAAPSCYSSVDCQYPSLTYLETLTQHYNQPHQSTCWYPPIPHQSFGYQPYDQPYQLPQQLQLAQARVPQACEIAATPRVDDTNHADERKEDRISALPDEILQHILSFIDIYEAIQTSILSKRWKHLWLSLLNIRMHLRGGASYHRHVSQFLSHRDAAAAVHDFHLSLDTQLCIREDLALVEECVLYAINHGVQSLRLHVSKHLHFRLPAALFTSTTLQELELREKDTWIHVPARFSLPNLKTLYLDVKFSFNYDDWRDPFAGLPELEKLSLRLWNGLVLKAPPKLRFLEIFGSNSVIRIKEISAPLLTSFRYKGCLPFECSEMNLPMLELVYLDIHGIKWKKSIWYHLNCVRLLHQLGNATIVSLTLDTLMFLELVGDSIEQSPPPFPNLKCLKVINGSSKRSTVLESVMNYLTIGTLYFESSLKVEIPCDVVVVYQHREAYDDLYYDDLYFEEDYTQSS